MHQSRTFFSNKELSKIHALPKNIAYAGALVALAKHYIDLKQWDAAAPLLAEAEELFAANTQPLLFFDLKKGSKRQQQLSMLVDCKSVDTFNGYCQALRRIIVFKDDETLQKFLNLFGIKASFADTNPKKGFTAMHLAIQGNQLVKAWLLQIYGVDMTIRSMRWTDENGALHGGDTCLDLLEKSDNPQMKMLTESIVRLGLEKTKDDMSALEFEALLNQKIAALSHALGVSDATRLIFLKPLNKLIVVGLYIPSNLTRYYLNFATKALLSVPDLTGCVDLASLTTSPDRPDFPKKKFSFVFSLNRAIRIQRASNIFQQAPVNVEFSGRLFADLISAVLSDAGFLHADQFSITSNAPPQSARARISVELNASLPASILLFLKSIMEMKIAEDETLRRVFARCDDVIEGSLSEQIVAHRGLAHAPANQ